MSALDDLLVIEEGFWRAAGLRDSYAAHLADDSVHVFPGWGVTSDNERVLQAVDSVDPWESFEIEEPTLLELSDGAAALVYTARAHRAGEDEYVAAMTSVYRETGDGWKLVIHHRRRSNLRR
jgi:ketosteroid isomerase-like protein